MNHKKNIAALLTSICLVSCGGNTDVAEIQEPQESKEVHAFTVTDSELFTDSSVIKEDDSTPSDNTESVSENLYSEEEKEPVEYTNIDSSFVPNLFLAVCKEDIIQGKNVFISPFSVEDAMGMVLNGARGQTFEELKSVLCENMSLNRYNRIMELHQVKYNEDYGVAIQSSNSVWINSKVTENIEPFYQDLLEETYTADCINEEFDKDTAELINGWVALNTLGKIPSVISNIDPDTAMVIVNAIAFEGKWEQEYDDSSVDLNGIFHDRRNNEQSCVMLSGKEDIYIKSDNAEGFIKPYAGGEYGFMGILPKDHMNEYINNFSSKEWETLLHSKVHEPVFTKMPEFSSEYSKTLNAPLQSMGIKQAFSDEADFSKITKDKSLKISKVSHKAVVNLDRHGTKASAATAITMETNSITKAEDFHYVYLDKPFMYAIIDMSTFEPVFMGVYQTTLC